MRSGRQPVHDVKPTLFCRALGRSAACRRFLAVLARNGKQHLALSLTALTPLLRRSGRGFFLRNAAAERVHEVHNVLRPRCGALARHRNAGLLLLEHLDHGFFIMIDEL